MLSRYCFMGCSSARSPAILPVFHPQYERAARRSTAGGNLFRSVRREQPCADQLIGRALATPIDHAALHDELHVLDRGNVPGGVALHGDDIRVESLTQLTELVLLPKDPRVHRCG